jgi:hypothetical protein
MSKFIRFTDAITGHASIKKGLAKDFTNVKDSTSPTGKSLVAQIEMTHSGIVTRNSGFYLPDNMRKGAHTFTKNYKKPVLVGHDSDSEPVGRVIQADYIDTSFTYVQNDKYLSSLMRFQDKKENKKNSMTDFVQHVIGEYNGKDGYRGLGHILGTLKITDEETIQKVLDERHLTVSISTSADAAFCSECGTDWVAEGPCEHERGQVYDSGIPVVLIPGSMRYNHVGFVSEPADEFAAGFKGIELIENDSVKQLDSVIQVKTNNFSDKLSVAANLFSYQDGKGLFSLSDEAHTNLLEVKDNIQRLEDSLKTMEKDKMSKFADDVSANISFYLYGEEGESTTMEIRKYAKTMTPADLEALAKKAAAALASQESVLSTDSIKGAVYDYLLSEVTPTEVVEDNAQVAETTDKRVITTKKMNERFKLVDGTEYSSEVEDAILAEIQKIEGVNLTDKEVTELTSLIARSQNGDALASLTLDTKDKSVEDCVKAYVDSKDSRFKLSGASAEDVVNKMNDNLSEETKIAFDTVLAKDCAGSGKYFPILNKAQADAAKKVLGLTIAKDSIRSKILENIEKIGAKYVVDKAVEEVVATDATTESTEIFDSTKTGCDNQMELTNDALVAELTKLVQLAADRNLIDSIIAPYLAERELEIGVLEQQLNLANDEINDLLSSLQEVKDTAKKDLAEKVVDAKIKSGLFDVTDRELEISKHVERSEDSLQDALTDLGKAKTPAISDSEKISSPVLADDSKDLNTQIVNDNKSKEDTVKELKKKDLLKTYNLLKMNKGKAFADSWLNKQNF